MSSAFLSDFEDRKRQVRHYLAIVISAERIAGLGTSTRTQERRLLTLRAGTFLILYNLIEATTRGAVQAIHDQITTERVAFGSLTMKMRAEVVRRFKLRADPEVNHTMEDLPSRFVAVALDKQVYFSGNVDARYIKELGACYGFSCRTSASSRDGIDLLTIKDKRNDLAHGIQTFEEVGRDYTASDLLSLSRGSLSYMDGILKNIASYLEARGYLDR
ncbi:MAG TPA: MAE_28990/MAE_18760 family HEPN-like nuclease [Acetobacteraceae bacterium]|nr:MAE_28990/MAE_18760 family HEPN-like nuclease [Acetobacteraceae bacterium]